MEKGDAKKRSIDVKTYSVPFALEENKESITTVTKNSSSKLSKEQIINKAFNLHSQGKILEAAKYYQNFIDQGFTDARVYSNYGLILNNLGKLEEAEKLYCKAINLKPDFAEAYFNLGNTLSKLFRSKEAQQSYCKAIEIKPDFAEAYFNLGNILKEFGQLEEAQNSYRKAIELKSDYANAYFNLGNTLKELNQLEEAQKLYFKVIELKPEFAEAYFNLGNILKELNQLEESEKLYRKTIEIKPVYAAAYSNLGSLLIDLGRLKEAEIWIRKAIEINPEFAEAYSNLCNLFRERGQLKEAVISQTKAIELDPMNNDMKINLINLFSIYSSKEMDLNPFFLINNHFRDINLKNLDNQMITDKIVIKIYNDGLKIYQKNNLDLVSTLLQTYKRNNIHLDCKRHFLLFNNHKIIPQYCFSCYKIQLEPKSIIEFLKLFIIFENLNLSLDVTRKCMVETRNGINGFYKGLIYCSSLEEACYVKEEIDKLISKKISFNLKSKIKRGCSEFALEYPLYKEINKFGVQPMNYKENWKKKEIEIDSGYKEWGKATKSIEGFNLNNFLIIRNWIAYAQIVGDKSVSQITKEQIKGPKEFDCLNRDF